MFSDEKTDVVTFAENDPEEPIHWPLWRKLSAPAEPQLQREYGVNEETTSAGLTLYVFGFALGPLICELLWYHLTGPMSEMFGRKSAYTVSWPLLIGAIAPSAFADNIAVILLFRFFTGVCASCALTNMFYNNPHALSKVGFFVAAATEGGSALWVVRVHFFFVFACWPLVFLLPETHGPSILGKRAARLRAEGHSNAWAAHETSDQSKADIIRRHVFRPAQMLLREPINQGAAVWISLAYGIIYFFFEAYPVVFIEQHDIPFRLCGLMFIPLPIGMLFWVAPYDYINLFFSRIRIPGIEPKSKPTHAAEARLRPAVLCWQVSAMLPISLFWFAWTSGREVHWIAPAIAGAAFGFAMMGIFMTFLAYLTQTYTVYASSANACNNFARATFAAALPLITHPLLNGIGTKWGVSLFGFLSLILIPVPLIFLRYGEKLRERSHFAHEAMMILQQTQAKAESSSEGEKHSIVVTVEQ
ncbi:MFS general substrate transporter [Dentipellis sp. KUC8613]|nr:MFS general substrate transporter [Dentipellis sp. KUC8613]